MAKNTRHMMGRVVNERSGHVIDGFRFGVDTYDVFDLTDDQHNTAKMLTHEEHVAKCQSSASERKYL